MNIAAISINLEVDMHGEFPRIITCDFCNNEFHGDAFPWALLRDRDKKKKSIDNYTGFRCKHCGIHVCKDCCDGNLEIDDEIGWSDTTCPKCKEKFGPEIALVGEHANAKRLAGLRDIRKNYLNGKTKRGGWEPILTLSTMIMAMGFLLAGMTDTDGLGSPIAFLSVAFGTFGIAFGIFRLLSYQAVFELIDASYLVLLGIFATVAISLKYPADSKVPIYFAYSLVVILLSLAGAKFFIFYKDKERSRIARKLLQE